jgi:hypothetical protein
MTYINKLMYLEFEKMLMFYKIVTRFYFLAKIIKREAP